MPHSGLSTLQAQAPIFVRDPYMFFYPQLCHPGSTNMCDVSLMYKIMRWLLRCGDQ